MAQPVPIDVEKLKDINRKMADILLRLLNSDPNDEQSQPAIAEIRDVLMQAGYLP